jgi:hypothetical protein
VEVPPASICRNVPMTDPETITLRATGIGGPIRVHRFTGRA